MERIQNPAGATMLEKPFHQILYSILYVKRLEKRASEKRTIDSKVVIELYLSQREK
jgi:hypothetical protein